MNLFHLSLLPGMVALVLRAGFLLGRWSLRQRWFWRDFLDASLAVSASSPDAGPPMRGALLRAFVRERLEVWRASLLWGHDPLLSWRERAAIVRVQCCLLLAHGLMTLVGWPARLEPRWSRGLHQRLTTLVGDEAVLKRVTLVRLYPTAEDVPTGIAQSREVVQ